jgi:hypothetical protein
MNSILSSQCKLPSVWRAPASFWYILRPESYPELKANSPYSSLRLSKINSQLLVTMKIGKQGDSSEEIPDQDMKLQGGP